MSKRPWYTRRLLKDALVNLKTGKIVRFGSTCIEMIPPWHRAGPVERLGEKRKVGRSLVQTATDKPVNVDMGDVGQVTMQSIESISDRGTTKNDLDVDTQMTVPRWNCP
jgi:hypothetical protein